MAEIIRITGAPNIKERPSLLGRLLGVSDSFISGRKAKDHIYKGYNITHTYSENGTLWYMAENPKGGPVFFTTELKVAKKFINKYLNN